MASVLVVAFPIPVILLVPIAIAPVIVPPANGSFVAIDSVIVVAKLGSSAKAAANSFSVSNVPGAEATRAAMAVSTYNLFATSVFKVQLETSVILYEFIDNAAVAAVNSLTFVVVER